MTSLNLNTIGRKTEKKIYKYKWKDVVLYNISIGAQPEELEFVYERTPGGVKVFPSYACIVATEAFPNISKKEIDGSRFIHGEQMIKLYKPFPSEGEMKVQGVCENIFDKQKAAVTHIKISGTNKSGEKVFDTKYVHFYLGEGGFGGDPGPKTQTLEPPKHKDPDFSISYKTNKNQAALYRLNQDLNPLHIDPEFAKKSGKFDKPILHGLCTFGFATRAIVHSLCDGDVNRFKEFKARFTSEVYPGETLTTEGWKYDERYIIQMRTSRGPIVLGNSYAIVK